MQQAGNELLRRHQSSLAREVPVVTQVVEGDPPEQIISVAVAVGADMIVIGTDSRGRLAHFILGSTADTVIRYAPCPVLAVRADRSRGRHARARGEEAALN